MNKIAIALSAALSLGAMSSANAADATINFTGKIEALTCGITVGAGGSGTSVTMPTLSANVINSGVGSVREQAFTLNVGATGTKCAEGDYIFTFNGKNLEEGRLRNTATTGAASNVELAILDGAKELDLRTDEITRSIDASGITTIPLTARYEKAAAGDAGNGAFATALEIFVQY
ncbi:fimbrial protein [Stenotrophomonas forensis]|uniref:fimbrial protein n=1 Tax=Stenotrophomonas forensis TaxID=2871169 RepID=UPI0036D5D6D1